MRGYLFMAAPKPSSEAPQAVDTDLKATMISIVAGTARMHPTVWSPAGNLSFWWVETITIGTSWRGLLCAGRDTDKIRLLKGGADWGILVPVHKHYEIFLHGMQGRELFLRQKKKKRFMFCHMQNMQHKICSWKSIPPVWRKNVGCLDANTPFRLRGMIINTGTETIDTSFDPL